MAVNITEVEEEKPLNGTLLDRAAILAVDDLRRERLAMPEWGGEVFVRGMTAAERDRWERLVFDNASEAMRASVVAWCTVDAAGKQLFSAADVDALGQKNGVACERILAKAQELSAVGEAAGRALEKNSSTGPSDGST